MSKVAIEWFSIWVKVCIMASLGMQHIVCDLTTQNPPGDWHSPKCWSCGDIPDPQVDIWKCGHGGKVSHVCNPEHVLTDKRGAL